MGHEWVVVLLHTQQSGLSNSAPLHAWLAGLAGTTLVPEPNPRTSQTGNLDEGLRGRTSQVHTWCTSGDHQDSQTEEDFRVVLFLESPLIPASQQLRPHRLAIASWCLKSCHALGFLSSAAESGGDKGHDQGFSDLSACLTGS